MLKHTFFSYEFYQRYGIFPFEERGHGWDGVLQTYSDLFGETDQVAWWNKRMVEKRLLVTVILTVLLVLVFWLLSTHYNTLTMVFCSAGIIIKIVERIVENGRYFSVSKEIDGALNAVEASPSKKGVLLLQDLIDKRRSINVLESNGIHKKVARKLTQIYERMNP